MIGKSKIKFLTSLRENKYRKIHRAFIAEGNTLVKDFMSGKRIVKEVFALKSWIEREGDKYHGIKIEEVTVAEMKKISNLKNPSEVLAVVSSAKEDSRETLPQKGWSLVLDGIRDPGNLGTIIRTAEWFGINTVFCSPDTVDAYNPKVVQATMGSLARVKVVYTPLFDLLSEKPPSLTVYGTLLNGEDIRNIKKQSNGAIIIGSEAHGISKEIIPLIDKKVTVIPAAASKAESLNASVAAAIACFALI